MDWIWNNGSAKKRAGESCGWSTPAGPSRSEQIVWRVLTDIKLSLSLNQLRRELAYLRDLGLIELEGEECDIWFAQLTAPGVDVVEYTTKAPAGVARPRKYW
jgi:hypothetical protein